MAAGAFVPVPSASGTVHIKIMADDVNGDGSDIKTYVVATRHALSAAGALSVSTLGTFTDETLTTAYTPLMPKDPSEIGKAVVASRQHRIELTGPTSWTLPEGQIESVLVTVRTVASPALPPTISTIDGITPLYAGDAESFAAIGETLMTGPFVVTANAGDVIGISYIEARLV